MDSPMVPYYRPATLTECLALLDARYTIVAGATDVYPARVTRRASGRPVNNRWVDISGVQGLRGVTVTPTDIRIGALTTWSDLFDHDLPPAFDGLKAAAKEVGGRQIQNRGTLAGNLCNASPAADGVPPLLCLDASVELTSVEGTRTLPLSSFLIANRRTARKPGELLSAIVVPTPSARVKTGFGKIGARRYLVISIAMVAVAIETDDSDVVTDVKLSVGSCSPVATRLPHIEQQLIDQFQHSDNTSQVIHDVVTEHAFAQTGSLTPITDIRSDAAYRLSAAVVLTRRVLHDLVVAPGDTASQSGGAKS